MRPAVLIGVAIALLLAADVLMNNGEGTRAIRQGISDTVGSILD